MTDINVLNYYANDNFYFLYSFVDDYLFHELLELVDLDFKAYSDSSGCSQFHFMPRFVRDLPGKLSEILSLYIIDKK